MEFATFDDVQARFPDVISGQRLVFIETSVGDANAVLDQRMPSLAERCNNNPNLARLAKMVVVNAVIRATDNPHDFTSESVGGFSYGRNPRQNVWFRDDELELLQPVETLIPASSVYMKLGPQWAPYDREHNIDTWAYDAEHFPHHREF